MDKYTMIKDFFIESFKVNLDKIFSFNCEKELQSDKFAVDILDDIFIKRIPILMQIISSNALDHSFNEIYSLFKEKIKETSDLIDRIAWDNKEDYHSAKLNGVQFKICGSVLLMTISSDKGIELRDKLRKDILEYISIDGMESFALVLTEIIRKIGGIEKSLDIIKQVLELCGITKAIIDSFIDVIEVKKGGYSESIPVKQSVIKSDCNDEEFFATFLSKKRNPSKGVQTQNENNNDSNPISVEKGKNKVIEDYFKQITSTAKRVNNSSNTYKIPISKKSKRKMSQIEEEDKQTIPPISNYLNIKKASTDEQKQRKNNDINNNKKFDSLIGPSIANSFNKSTTYSNSFCNFEVTSFHNSEISLLSKTTLPNNIGFRGINAKLSNNSIMQKFSVKKKKKPKKNTLSEKIIEKCRSFCPPIEHSKQDPDKHKQLTDLKLEKIKKMLQKNFYANNHSNGTSMCNSKENSNNIPWNLQNNINTNTNVETKAESCNKYSKENEDNVNKKGVQKEEEEDDDEILVYKTPEKLSCKKMDYSLINHNTLKKNLYALFTQSIN